MKINPEISKQVVTVKLSFGSYAGHVGSKKLSKELADSHEADEDSITAKVRALKPEALRKIRAKRTAAKALWKAYSLPMDDEGKRMMSATRYVSLRNQLNQIRAEWLDEVQAVVDDWDNLVADAKKRLNGLFAEAKMPTKIDVASRFRFDITVGTLADVRNVTLDALTGEEIARVKAEMEASQEAVLIEAHRDILDRVAEVVEHLVERLSDDEATLKKSVTANAAKVADKIDELNLIKSEKLTDLANRLRKQLAVDVDTLRDDEKAKSKVKKQAKAILGELATFEF